MEELHNRRFKERGSAASGILETSQIEIQPSWNGRPPGNAKPCVLSVGKTLIKVGETERRLGGAERDFIHGASINFLTPLRNFLEGDWRTISVRKNEGQAG